MITDTRYNADKDLFYFILILRFSVILFIIKTTLLEFDIRIWWQKS